MRERSTAEPFGSAPPLLLDTHVWLWWLEGHPSLSATTRAALLDAQRNHIRSIGRWWPWRGLRG
jgi:PIN domain nuclease of toxin-antitoxin system